MMLLSQEVLLSLDKKSPHMPLLRFRRQAVLGSGAAGCGGPPEMGTCLSGRTWWPGLRWSAGSWGGRRTPASSSGTSPSSAGAGSASPLSLTPPLYLHTVETQSYKNPRHLSRPMHRSNILYRTSIYLKHSKKQETVVINGLHSTFPSQYIQGGSHLDVITRGVQSQVFSSSVKQKWAGYLSMSPSMLTFEYF